MWWDARRAVKFGQTTNTKSANGATLNVNKWQGAPLWGAHGCERSERAGRGKRAARPRTAGRAGAPAAAGGGSGSPAEQGQSSERSNVWEPPEGGAREASAASGAGRGQWPRLHPPRHERERAAASGGEGANMPTGVQRSGHFRVLITQIMTK